MKIYMYAYILLAIILLLYPVTFLLCQIIKLRKRMYSFIIGIFNEIKDKFKENKGREIAKSVPYWMVLIEVLLAGFIVWNNTKNWIRAIVVVIILLFILVGSYCIIYYALITYFNLLYDINNVEKDNFIGMGLLLLTTQNIILTVLLVEVSNDQKNIAFLWLIWSVCLLMVFIILMCIYKALIQGGVTIKNASMKEKWRFIIFTFSNIIWLFANWIQITNTIDNDSFLEMHGYFDAMYYTLISFTTIGYGDILPLSNPAKIITMFISLSSIVFLIAFLNTMMSMKDDERKYMLKRLPDRFQHKNE